MFKIPNLNISDLPMFFFFGFPAVGVSYGLEHRIDWVVWLSVVFYTIIWYFLGAYYAYRDTQGDYEVTGTISEDGSERYLLKIRATGETKTFDNYQDCQDYVVRFHKQQASQ